MTNKNKIPSDWQETTIQKCCDILDNQRIPITKSKRESGNIPYYGATGQLDYVKDYIFDEELVLVGEDGADWSRFAKTAFIIKGKSWVNNHAHVLRCKTINPIFFRDFLNMSDLKIYINGTTRGKLNQESLKKIKILLPPLPEQEKIASILSKADEQIQLTEEIIAKTEELKKGLMQQLLTKGIGHTEFKETELGMIPKEWEVVPFGIKLDIMSGKGFKYSEYSEKGVRLLKIDNVSYNHIKWENITYLPENYIKDYPSLCLKEKDILIALNRPITNNKLKIGMLTKNDVPSILYQRVGKILYKEPQNKDFIYYKLSYILLPFIEQNNVGGNIPFINLSQLRTLKMSFPPIEEQEEISKILNIVFEQLDSQKKELKKLKELKKGLMQDLLSGKVRVKV